MSAVGMWNSVDAPSEVQSSRCIPRSGRTRRSETRSSSGEQTWTRSVLHMKTSSPAGRRRRAASGIHLKGSHQIDAPYSEKARSNDPPDSGTSSAFASINSSPRPNSSFIARAASSCAGVMSTPTTRAAPCFFSHAPKYAVPQPSSITSRPRRSGRMRNSDSRFFHTPQWMCSCAQRCRARAFVYSAFDLVQCSRAVSA